MAEVEWKTLRVSRTILWIYPLLKHGWKEGATHGVGPWQPRWSNARED